MRGTPSHHPVVTDDHDLVLKPPWWRLGIPYFKKLPYIITHIYISISIDSIDVGIAEIP
jgi:hypothetical protein